MTDHQLRDLIVRFQVKSVYARSDLELVDYADAFVGTLTKRQIVPVLRELAARMRNVSALLSAPIRFHCDRC